MGLSGLKTLFVVGFALAHAAFAFAGAWMSGGGSAVKFGPDKLVLLDFFNTNPSFVDTYNDPSSKEILRHIRNGELAALMGRTVRVNVRGEPSYLLANQRLTMWESHSPTTVKALKYVLAKLYFNMSAEVSTGDDLEIHSRIPDLVPVAYYSKHEQNEVLIGIHNWAMLGDKSKAGLFIHESVRRLQFEFGLQIDEATLHTITSKIMLEDPARNSSLDELPSIQERHFELLAISRPVEAGCRKLANLRYTESNIRMDTIYRKHCLSFTDGRDSLQKFYFEYKANLLELMPELRDENRSRAYDLYLLLFRAFNTKNLEDLAPL